MLNQTSWKQVDQVSPIFFSKWPTPQSLLKAVRAEIVETIRSLGFYNRRADSLIKLSRGWVELQSEFSDPTQIPISKINSLSGVGRYALDSWKIFQLGDLSVDPTDKVLVEYINAARQNDK